MKKNKKVIITSAIALVLLLGIGAICLRNNDKDDIEIAVNTESEDALASADLDVDTVIKETEEVETSEVEASEILETPEVEVTTESVEMETTATPAPTNEVEVIEETPTPTSDEPSTTVPANADAYIPYDAGKTYTVHSANETIQVTVPSSYALPYIVNGIDIRTGDTNGDGLNDVHQNTWYAGQTWTASNGVTIRIADGFELAPGHGNIYSIFYDRTENCEPGSDFMYACSEYMGMTEVLELDISSLPNVVPVSTKQTTINESYPSFVAYKQVFDPLWGYQNNGNAVDSLACLQPYDSNQDGVIDGIGLMDTVAHFAYMWTMDYDAANGYWKLTIKGNYTELIWNSILNSLRMVTPDADAVFDTIYNDYYYGVPGLENPDSWITIGSTNLCYHHVNSTSFYYCIK